jgi:4-hydroxybenzoate polyprenyltransferase
MNLIPAFLRLIRWPNLVFIALTQFLFQFCVYYPVFAPNAVSSSIGWFNFTLLVLASVVIAAAGYIINDYFDINIDMVNKPHKLVVDKVINRRWAIVLHSLLSFIGVVLTLLIVKDDTRAWLVAGLNFICTIALLFYSTTFKKKLLIGNILISLLTAWTVWVVVQIQLPFIGADSLDLPRQKLIRIGLLYSGFAFIISLIREGIKDIEDIEGDRRYGCRTMPIVWGINVSKVFIAVWIVALVGILVAVQFYVMQFNWWISITYCFACIVAPLLYILWKLYKATSTADYTHLSRWVKITMFTGIISMIFFLLYNV